MTHQSVVMQACISGCPQLGTPLGIGRGSEGVPRVQGREGYEKHSALLAASHNLGTIGVRRTLRRTLHLAIVIGWQDGEPGAAIAPEAYIEGFARNRCKAFYDAVKPLPVAAAVNRDVPAF